MPYSRKTVTNEVFETDLNDAVNHGVSVKSIAQKFEVYEETVADWMVGDNLPTLDRQVEILEWLEEHLEKPDE